MTEEVVKPKELTVDLLDKWAMDAKSAVALVLKQTLLPVQSIDSDNGIIFPPTYADIGYNIDTLSDGTSVALIDSIGSQANRLEPLFKQGGPYADLVPQLEIEINGAATVSIHELPHRVTDATVLASDLISLVQEAIAELQKGNAVPLCQIAPTSLVFGFWDSRGSGEKRPRLVRSIVRAWDVKPLHMAAQFNSVWKKLEESQRMELKELAKKEKVKLSEIGFADAPAVFRPKTKSPQGVNGSPNSDARVLGGVLVKGRIEREVTVNLVALRGLLGRNDDDTKHLRQYLLGLALLAATADIDFFLREGCHLRQAKENVWSEVPRRGDPVRVAIEADEASKVIREYAEKAAVYFKAKWPDKLKYKFDIAEAKKLLIKKLAEKQKESEEG